MGPVKPRLDCSGSLMLSIVRCGVDTIRGYEAQQPDSGFWEGCYDGDKSHLEGRGMHTHLAAFIAEADYIKDNEKYLLNPV